MADKRSLLIEICNLTEPQVIALEDLLATWVQLGSHGASRWTAFYADGDGDFRPRITVNGETPKFTDLLPRNKFWPDQHEYRIDFDAIAWKLGEAKEKSGQPSKEGKTNDL